MFPQFYQIHLEKKLKPAEYLTLKILGVAELQYESMIDNKVNFYEMPWMQLNSYPQKWNSER